MKTLASLLLISATFAGANVYAASPNIEPNNVPFQGVYGHVDANAPTRAQIVAELQAANEENSPAMEGRSVGLFETESASDHGSRGLVVTLNGNRLWNL